MNNANKPAYPQSNDEISEAFMEVEDCAPNGLTKRERFAMAAMQGLLSNRYLMENVTSKEDDRCYGWIAIESKKYADALLKELEETNE